MKKSFNANTAAMSEQVNEAAISDAMDGAVSVTQAIEMTSIKRATLYAMMLRGELRYSKINGRRVILKRDIAKLLASHLVGA